MRRAAVGGIPAALCCALQLAPKRRSHRADTSQHHDNCKKHRHSSVSHWYDRRRVTAVTQMMATLPRQCQAKNTALPCPNLLMISPRQNPSSASASGVDLAPNRGSRSYRHGAASGACRCQRRACGHFSCTASCELGISCWSRSCEPFGPPPEHTDQQLSFGNGHRSWRTSHVSRAGHRVGQRSRCESQ